MCICVSRKNYVQLCGFTHKTAVGLHFFILFISIYDKYVRKSSVV
jgi:hypothetical protein